VLLHPLLDTLAFSRIGRKDEAIEVYRDAAAAWRRLRPPGDPQLIQTLDNMGMVLYQDGRFGEAEEVLREALAESRRVFGSRSPHEDHILAYLSRIEARRGNFDEELALLREGLEASKGVYRPGHRYRREAEKHLVEALFRQAEAALERGDRERARRLLRELEELRERENPDSLQAARLAGLRNRLAR